MAAEQVAVPAQDGVGGDDQVGLSKLAAGEAMEQGGEERPVRSGEAGLVYLTLQDTELVAQRQISMSLLVSLVGSSRMKANTLVSAR